MSSDRAKSEKRVVRSPRPAEVTADQARAVDRARLALICVVAWAWPGAGHLWLGRTLKGVIFAVAIPFMFGIGLALQGRLFPVDPSQPLIALAALANMSVGIIYLVANAAGYGAGTVVAPTYEYGNTFLIVAGLLNLLVIIDAYDIAVGRK